MRVGQACRTHGAALVIDGTQANPSPNTLALTLARILLRPRRILLPNLVPILTPILALTLSLVWV